MSTMMSMTRVDHVTIQVHGKHPPSEAEWTRFCALATACHAEHGDASVGLALTDGGAPTNAQRDQLMGVVDVRKLPTAVVGVSAGTRFVVAAISIIHPHIKAFAAGDFTSAMRHLGIDGSTESRIRAALPKLADEVGGSKTVATVLGG